MRISDLFEAYHTTIAGPYLPGTVEVFRNPSRLELNRMIAKSEHKVMRGLFHRDGDLYVWSDEEAEHMPVEDQLGISTDIRLFLSRDQLSYYRDDAFEYDGTPKDVPAILGASDAVRRLYGKSPTTTEY